MSLALVPLHFGSGRNRTCSGASPGVQPGQAANLWHHSHIAHLPGPGRLNPPKSALRRRSRFPITPRDLGVVDSPTSTRTGSPPAALPQAFWVRGASNASAGRIAPDDLKRTGTSRTPSRPLYWDWWLNKDCSCLRVLDFLKGGFHLSAGALEWLVPN